jgi:hypothetical protein
MSFSWSGKLDDISVCLLDGTVILALAALDNTMVVVVVVVLGEVMGGFEWNGKRTGFWFVTVLCCQLPRFGKSSCRV